MVKSCFFRLWQRGISLVLIFTLTLGPNFSYAQSAFVSTLPEPGTMVGTSTVFTPVLVKGLVVHPDKPLNFDFIVDSGNDDPSPTVVKSQSQRMAQYFLAAITVPEDQLWVNLSPYEKDRIIESELGQTVLGRDMLAQDYILKQLTSSLIYPERGLGKEFWTKVYKEVQDKFGTTDIPIDTFNKVWIMPEQAEVFEKGNAVYVTDAKLKVMLDTDRTAMTKSISDSASDEKTAVAKAVMREIVLPAIEKEVNEGKNFSVIRQIYYTAILAKWYRESIQNSLLADVYVGKNKVAGVTVDEKGLKEKIYQRYIAAYKKGVFNYIKEDYDPIKQDVVPRKYFSGGENLHINKLNRTEDSAKAGRHVGKVYQVDLAMSSSIDMAMTGLEAFYPIDIDWNSMGVINDSYWLGHAEIFERNKENDGQPMWFFDELLKSVAKDAPILELATGSGRAVVKLRETGYSNITGSDISSEALAMAQQKGIPKDSLIQLNIKTDPIPGRYEAIIANDIFLYFTPEEIDIILRKIRNALNDGGKIGFRWAAASGDEPLFIRKDAGTEKDRWVVHASEKLIRRIMNLYGFRFISDPVLKKEPIYGGNAYVDYWYCLAEKISDVDVQAEGMATIASIADTRVTDADAMSKLKDAIDVTHAVLRRDAYLKERFMYLLHRSGVTANDILEFLKPVTLLGVIGHGKTWNFASKGSQGDGAWWKMIMSQPEFDLKVPINRLQHIQAMVEAVDDYLAGRFEKIEVGFYKNTTGVDSIQTNPTAMYPVDNGKRLTPGRLAQLFEGAGNMKNLTTTEVMLFRIAVVLHDYGRLIEGKGFKMDANGRIVFDEKASVQHRDSGVVIAGEFLKAMGFTDQNEIKVIEFLVRRHDAVWSLYAGQVYGQEWAGGYSGLKSLAKEIAELSSSVNNIISPENVSKMLTVIAIADVYASGDRYLSDRFIDFTAGLIDFVTTYSVTFDIKHAGIMSGLHTTTGGKGFAGVLEKEGAAGIAILADELQMNGILSVFDVPEALTLFKSRHPEARAGFFITNGVKRVMPEADFVVGLEYLTPETVHALKNENPKITVINVIAKADGNVLVLADETVAAGADGVQLKPMVDFVRGEQFEEAGDIIQVLRAKHPDLMIVGAGGVFGSRFGNVVRQGVLPAVAFKSPEELPIQAKEYRTTADTIADEAMGKSENIREENPSSFAITGATGSVGTQLLRQLLASRDTKAVYVLVRKQDGRVEDDVLLRQKLLLDDPRVHVVQGDLLDESKLKTLVSNSDVIYHLAGWAGLGQKSVEDAVRDNVVPTVMLSRLAQNQGKRLVLASTVHFYNLGSQREGVVSEENLSLSAEQLGKVEQMLTYADKRADQILAGESTGSTFIENVYGKDLYAFTKLTAERAVLRASKGLALRMANVYGPGDDTDRQVPKFIKSMGAGAGVVTYIPGRVNSFIYVKDLVKAFAAAGRVAVGPKDRIINVASPNLVSQKDLFEGIKQTVGSETKVESMSAADVERLGLSSPPPVIFDTARMSKVLGIQDTTNMQNGLSETKEWLMAPADKKWGAYPADLAMNGGIDIQGIDVGRKSGGVKIHFNDRAVRDVLRNGFNGFTPVIINIMPIQNPLMTLGEAGKPVLGKNVTLASSAT